LLALVDSPILVADRFYKHNHTTSLHAALREAGGCSFCLGGIKVKQITRRTRLPTLYLVDPSERQSIESRSLEGLTFEEKGPDGEGMFYTP